MNTTHNLPAIEWNAAPVRAIMQDLRDARALFTNWASVTEAGTLRTTCLISAMRSELGPNHNKARHAELGGKLAAIQDALPIHFEEVTGSWEGVEEKTYLATIDMPCSHPKAMNFSARFLRQMYALAHTYEQDALLFQHGDKAPAVLWSRNGEAFVTLEGRLTCVSPMEAHKQPGWTRKADGSYWIVKA